MAASHPPADAGPLVNYSSDHTTLQRFQIKGTYNYNQKWAFNAGYAYEKYDYSDGQMAGYGGYYPYFANCNTADAAERRVAIRALRTTRARSPTRATSPTWSG